jgi:hypothetical protein
MDIFQLAYIDPGSGSIIWQAAMGGILGGAYIVRNSIGRIITRGRYMFSRGSSENSSAKTTESQK